MNSRTGYAGAVGLLLTLGCGPRVEIGHGMDSGGSGGSGAVGGTVSSAGTGVGATTTTGGDTSAAGEPSIEPTAGTSSAAGAKPGVGGPIPADNGPQAEVSKVDLLLAVDNSISMAEKQRLFAQTVPELLTRLLSPHCVTAAGAVTAEPTSPEAACPAGSQREFEPLRDLHVGVITSSLGSHGAAGAKDVCTSAEDDDHAHLIPFVRPGVDSYDGQGYLNWDPDGSSNPPGESDVSAFASSLSNMLESVGETGCGYEAQLESVYRFLVDPEPPKSIAVPAQSATAGPVGVDQALLDQRANFLRPDSSIVVLMLTDENDCSIQDEGYGWLIARSAPMYRSTSACLLDANDPCCQSCAESVPNPGCSPMTEDSECAKGITLAAAEDDLNLRCFNQKQRFGFSLLYPIERYVSGFGDGMVLDRAGALTPNPLFHRDGVDRDRSLFTLAVIGGVPWQDLATASSLTGDTLEYMTAEELAEKKRWSVILGAPHNGVQPSDPFMRESTTDRSGKNPITGDLIVASTSTNPAANSINGHEQVTEAHDLQYACTFELPTPVVCDDQRLQSGQGCDCFADEMIFNRPLCNPPGGGAADITQYSGKAYPALRELAVAQQLGRRSVLGSICARNTQDDARSDYGYRPVFGAIGRRLASTLVKP
jgi:hypothetical protein